MNRLSPLLTSIAFTQAIAIEPRRAAPFFSRGRLHLFRGPPAKAQADFKQAAELEPKYAYHALWLEIADRRNKTPSRLKQAVPHLDMKAWPAPVVRLFLGEIPPEALLAAADNANAATKQEQTCEANFYGGEFALSKGAKEEAARLFRVALDTCPKTFLEAGAAHAELEMLGAAPN